MSSTEFQHIISKLNVLESRNGVVAISGERAQKKIIFEVNDGEVADGIVTIMHNDSSSDAMKKVSVTITDDFIGYFKLLKLAVFTKATCLSKRVKISLADIIPIKVSYTIGSIGVLTYHLSAAVPPDE